MPDKVKALKIENPATGGTQTDGFPTETNPSQDYLAAKGIAFENLDTRLIDLDGSGNIQFQDATETSYIQLWKLRTALYNTFDPTGIAFTSTNVQAALAELRTRVVTELTTTTASASGTLTLTSASNSLQIIDGSAAGYSVQLPNATTLFRGRKFEIPNRNIFSITIKDGSGATLTTLNSNDTLIATLRDNSSSAGSWILNVTATLAAGVNAFNVVASSTFSTSSSTDVLITGMTYTPPSGTYGVWFSADLNVGTNNARAQCVLFKDGAQVSDTRRTSQGAGSNFKTSFQTLGIAQVNGSQAIDVRVNTSSGTIDITGRSLLLIRLGA